MKNAILKIKLMLMVLSAILVFSCSGDNGEDGAIGPQGIAGADGINGNGTDGVDGQDGENGSDGEDGNANVIASDWIVADFPNSYSFSAASVTISDTNITQEVLNTYTILGYFSFTDSFTGVYSIPFTEPLFRSFTMQQKVAVGEYVITELGNPDTVSTIEPIDGFVRYVLIAPSSLSGKERNNYTYSIIGMQQNGVDLSNYYEVMDYLGLDY